MCSDVAWDMPKTRTINYERVQFVMLLYCLIFLALNLFVWGWFLLHRQGRFPLGEPIERFGDLVRFTAKHQFGSDPRILDTEHLLGSLFPRNYLPFAAVIYVFLLQACAPYAVIVFAGIVLGGIAVACTALWRKARAFNAYRWYMGVCIFATGLTGWGTEHAIMRGNIEGVLTLFVLLGAWLYAQRHYRPAAIAFAAAACIKPYPLLWLVLLARHKKFREVGWGLSGAAVIFFASLLVFDPNPLRAWHEIRGEGTFFASYVTAFRALRDTMMDHSLLETMKTITRIFVNGGFYFGPKELLMSAPNSPFARLLYYVDLYITVPLCITIVKRVWNMPVLNQVFTLACVTTLLPFVANDYTLTVLLAPMGFGLIFLLQDVAEGAVNISTRQLLWFVLPCVWIMSINPLWVLHGVLKCIALFILLAASVSVPLPSTLFGEIGHEETKKVTASTLGNQMLAQ